MAAATCRDISRGYLDRAVSRGAITGGEALRVLDFWNEADSMYNPYAVYHDGYLEREARAAEITKRAMDSEPVKHTKAHSAERKT